MLYGVCGHCGKWGEAPVGFSEKKHFLACACNQKMFLLRTNPKEAGYQDKNKIMPTYTNQK